MVRRSIAFVGAALAAFHGWLFAAQVVSGAIADPGLLLRWLVAAGLVAGLVWLRRQHESLIGRRAIAIWVLAALLHGPALTSRIDVPGAPAIPEAVVTITLSLTMIGVVGVLAAATRRALVPIARLFRVVRAAVPLRALGPALIPAFAPRPPPVV